MVCDASHRIEGGATTCADTKSAVPEDEEIDLMVLSRADADHLGSANKIPVTFTVRESILLDHRRTTGSWKMADAAIKAP